MHTTGSRERLAREVVGAVLDGDAPATAAEVSGFNTAVTHRPALVVAAEGAGDVAAAVRHAREVGIPVAVQATGHGAADPVDGAVLVTTARMRGVTVDPHSRTARVEAGARWRSVIDAAVPHGLAPLSGSSSGVGVVGYTLGGGMGHLARRHGFAADHVRAVELVTADGTLRRVTAESDPELFWAVRGGQARFGIATAVEFGLVPVPEFFGGAVLFGPGDVERVLRAWAEWAPAMPEDVTTSVAVLRLPPLDSVPPPLRGVVSLALRFGLAGPPARGEALLAPMRAVAPALLDTVGPMSYAAVDGIHMDPTEPMPAVMRGGILHSLPPAALDALLGVAGPDVDIPLAMVELRLMGGALARPAAVPNAVAGREGAFSLSVVAPAPPPLRDVAPVVTHGVLRTLEPWSPGTTLVNFGGHGGEQALSRAWTPDVLERLRRVKAAVDPHDTFGGALGSAAGSLAGAEVGAELVSGGAR
ncbi:FAD-binding oxidoreductase [Fodinibacter luteus]|uniref:FAD-binding oxidoreductase n=1 Tax=Fodinibacter luteus TaxID=552064 RepID=A0ABP8K6C8_9MICO